MAARPPALFLAGDPGIGKTRLLDLVAERTRGLGGTVLRGRAFEAETVRPYGPWIDALAATAPPPDLVAGLVPGVAAGLAPLVPSLAASMPGAPAAADRGALHDAVRALLERWAERAGPLALVLDDVQWLDEASASLLHYVARAATGGRVLLACAARAGELGDNPAALRVVRTLDRERRLLQHRLEPLGAADTAAVVRAVNPAADVTAAFAASEGNPLFAIEIARAAAAGAETRDEPLAHLLDDRPRAAQRGGARDRPLGRRAGTLVQPGSAGPRAGQAVGRSRSRGWTSWSATASSARPPAGTATSRTTSSAARRTGVCRPRGGAWCTCRSRAVCRRPAATTTRWPARSPTTRPWAGTRCWRPRARWRPGVAACTCSPTPRRRRVAHRGLQQLHRVERLARIHLQIALLALLVDVVRGAPGACRHWKSTCRAPSSKPRRPACTPRRPSGFRARAMLYYTGERFDAARESSMRAVEEIGRTDALTRGRELAVSARCLLLLEKEIPQAQAMIGEARLLLGPESEQIPTLAWAAGLAAHHTGDRPAADSAFRAAIVGFEREQAHWERSQAITQRVKLALEHGDTAEARLQCQALAEVAARMTEGSEAAVAAGLAAVVERGACPGGVPTPESTARLEQGIRGLVAADSKAMLAYVLNVAAVPGSGGRGPGGRRGARQRRVAGGHDRRPPERAGRRTRPAGTHGAGARRQPPRPGGSCKRWLAATPARSRAGRRPRSTSWPPRSPVAGRRAAAARPEGRAAPWTSAPDTCMVQAPCRPDPRQPLSPAGRSQSSSRRRCWWRS